MRGALEVIESSATDVAGALLSLPEDQWFERKGATVSPQAFANAGVAFANADGGVIVVGLSDTVVEGTDARVEHRNKLMQALVDLTEPPVRFADRLVPCTTNDGRADHLLVLEIPPSEVVHATNRDEAYLRVGDQTRKLTYRQRRELEFDKGQSTFESVLVSEATLDELDAGLLDAYATGLAHPDAERLLRSRGLMSDRGITAAAVLCFGREPQRWFPQAYLRVLRYRGSERGTGRRQQLVADECCEGTVPLQIAKAQAVVTRLQPTRRALGERGRFANVALIPQDAWLEGIVNAAIHRSYSLAGDHVRVEIFDDRIEIENPGRFPGLAYNVDPLQATRFARNPHIARVCFDLDIGQELGEGIHRIFDEMRGAALADPVYAQTAGSVRLQLLAVQIDPEREARLPSYARDILALVREVGRLSTGDVADALNLSRPVVIDRLRALESEGLIQWVGRSARDPRAYWRLPQ